MVAEVGYWRRDGLRGEVKVKFGRICMSVGRLCGGVSQSQTCRCPLVT